MVVFKSLRITNLKRFSGEHVIPLHSQEGKVSIVAAQNGVGKTTVIDAFNLVLHGKRAIRARYPGVSFNDWLDNAFSAASEAEDGYKHISVGIELSTENDEMVHITRSYWFTDDNLEIEDEFGLTINGSPIRLESGESRKGVAEAWVEAVLPLSLTQRFFVDGERLSDLDIRGLDSQLKSGVDDLLGQGTIGKLNRHLHSIQKDTRKQMTPEDDRETLDTVMEIVDSCENELLVINEQIVDCATSKKLAENRMKELQDMLTEKGREDGISIGGLRIAHAVSSSELAQLRKEVHLLIEGSLPFIIAGVPEELEDWKYNVASDMINRNTLLHEAENIVDEALNIMDPPFKKSEEKRLKKAMKQISTVARKSEMPQRFVAMSPAEMERIAEIHSLLSLGNQASELSVLDSAIAKLDEFEQASRELQEHHEKMGLKAVANELAELGPEVGRFGAELIQLDTQREKKKSELSQAEEKIEAMLSAGNKDSKLERRISIIDQIREILQVYGRARRNQMSSPLEDAFSEGFNLLSRKAKDIEGVEIDSDTYDVIIKMKGFTGNWLDRDLSATEKQHVGLSLLFALRKLAQRPLPVVVDTPTSRMDTEHKGWSVTRFYPQLSHQVIVLATSDDLSDGLYESLMDAGVIGTEVRLEEVGTNMVNVIEAPLASYF